MSDQPGQLEPGGGSAPVDGPAEPAPLVAATADVRWVEAGDVWWAEAADSVTPDRSPPVAPVPEAPGGWVDELDRPGPRVLAADVWDRDWDHAPEVDPKEGAYQGRRRAPAPATRLWFVIALVAAGLAAAIGLPLALVSSGDESPSWAAGDQPAVGSEAGTPESVLALSATASAGPSGSAGPSPSAGHPGPPPTTASSSPPPAPPFAPLVIEAETGTLIGPAREVTNSQASSGSLVGFLGETQEGQGTLRFSGISVPATGTYRLTFYYRAEMWWKEVHVTVNGSEPRQIRTSRRTTCCGDRSVDVTLVAGGSNTVEFTNPWSRCADIDRIVISRP